MKPYIVGFTFARGGSKGCSRKNIRPLAGKPLIAHAIHAGQASKWIDKMVVSTDDPEIATVASDYGAEVPFLRPAELARDDSPEWLSWRHALVALQENESRPIDIFVSIPTTCPLRSVSDIDRCIEIYMEGDADVVLTVREAERNPFFSMVVLDENQNVRLLMPQGRPISNRQSAPPVFDVTALAYVSRPDFILRANGIFAGVVKGVVVPAERALDIDTELDFEFAEFLLGRTE